MGQRLPRFSRHPVARILLGTVAATAALAVMSALPTASACPEHDGADSGGKSASAAGKTTGGGTASGKTTKAKNTSNSGSTADNKNPVAASICTGASQGSECKSKGMN